MKKIFINIIIKLYKERDVIGFTLLCVMLLIFMFYPAVKSFSRYEEKKARGEYIHWKDLNGKNSIVVDKHLEKGYSGYHIVFKVNINDTIKEVQFVPSDLYDSYQVGDTIKYIGMKYE